MSKLNLNFATRIVALVTPRTQGDSGRSGELAKVLAQTNSPETKVVLDPSAHKKTEDEKQQLKQIKREWRHSLEGVRWLSIYGKLSVKQSLKL